MITNIQKKKIMCRADLLKKKITNCCNLINPENVDWVEMVQKRCAVPGNFDNQMSYVLHFYLQHKYILMIHWCTYKNNGTTAHHVYFYQALLALANVCVC